MSEEIVCKDGKVYVLFESACTKYIFGNLIRGDRVYAYEKWKQKHRWNFSGALKLIFIGDVLHNILHIALQDVAKTVDGVGFHILIVSETIELGAVNIVMGV